MGHQHKKRGSNPAQRPRPPPASSSSPDATPTAAAAAPASPHADGDPATIVFLVEDDHHAGPAPAPPPPPPPPPRTPGGGTEPPAVTEAVKQECERALMALRRGNHTKAIRLMKDAAARHGSSALLHRVHGTVSVKVASLMDDPNAKLRHLRSAVESARRASELSPSSVEFAHFHANLLYEAATDSKGYEEVVQECERALAIPDPVDPARESLHQDESQQRLGPTPETRVSHIHQELRSLIQKANIASISSWVKNLNGSAVGVGEEKVRLIPIRRLSSPEDPMEVRLIQSARRPNEIKKATKTPEERRKEIEVRVAAARLLQQNPTPSSSHEDEPSPPSSSPSPSSSSGSQRLVERRKLMNARKLMSSSDRVDQVKRFWNSMGPDKRNSFLEVAVSDLKQHFAASKDGAASDILSEALSFVEANGMWKFWLCCKCNEKFANSDSHARHVMHEHMGSLARKLQSVLPQEDDGKWLEMLIGGSWKPIDTCAAVKMLEDEQLLKYQSVARDNDSDDNCKDRDSLSDYWSSRDASDSSSSLQGDSNVDGICNGLTEERKGNYVANFSMGENNDSVHKWPLSNDAERLKLLERIHAMFQLLLKHRCLATAHLNKVVQFTMNELQGLPSGSHLLGQALDQSPLCISFLDASQLRKVLKFLQDLSHSCGLGRYSEKESFADDTHSATQGNDFQEEIVLSCDSSKLLLDRHLFRSETISDSVDDSGNNDCTDAMDTNAFITWLFAGSSTGEQLADWTHLREENFQQGIEVLQTLEKEFHLLQNACETKCEHLSYEKALQTIGNLQVEEVKGREHATKFGSQSYESILRRRREELLKGENDMPSTSGRFELDAISNVLKEAQSLNVSHFGYDEMTSGLTSRICEVDGDDVDWKMQDYLYQADTCIGIAVQRQKEQLSLELSKIDARIMRNVTGMQILENKLWPVSSFDYRLVILPLLKSFMRSCLEDLVDKDAAEKCDAAREAFLAELALDAKKNANKAGDHLKQAQEKKDKRKSKDYRKSKDIKAFSTNEQTLYSTEMEEKAADFLVATDASQIRSELITSDYLNEQEENRRRVELEAEERKLGEALEYQRKIENEAKQKHLAEQCRKARATSPGSTESVGSTSNTEYSGLENEPGHYKETTSLDDGPIIHLKGIEFGDFHWSEFPSSKVHQNYELDLSKTKPGNAESVDVNRVDKSSVNVSGQKIRRAPSQSHSKHKQGSVGISHNSVLPSDHRISRRENQHNIFVRSPEGSSRPLSEKENHAVSHSPNDVHFEDQTYAAGDNGTKTLRQLHAEEDDEERFQADIKKAVHQSLDMGNVGDATTEKNATGKDLPGAGLKNEVGEYNCFLNVIIQSLWHLRRFRDEFLRSSPTHMHVGDPCVICALYDIFNALGLVSLEGYRDAVAPTCLRMALSNLHPDSNFFQKAQMNDASEVLELIFRCLHRSFTSSVNGLNIELKESNGVSSWDCTSNSCIVHHLFGMNISEQMNCYNCGLESRHLKYTSFFHNVNASALRTMKIACADSYLDELLKNVEMNHQLACDMEAGGCGKPNYIHHILSTAPYFFTIVLGWQNACESADDISATLAAITINLDISTLYRGLDMGDKHSLVSVVCYYGQHYVCFAYYRQRDEWVMYDDNSVKVIGGWTEVLLMCEKGHLQPQVLFFEAVN